MKELLAKATKAKVNERFAHQAGLAKAKGGKAWTRLLKAIVAALAAIGILVAPGTVAGWFASESISDQTIRTGELSVEAKNATWELNNIEISESALSTTRLVPGDVLTYEATVEPTITGSMTAELAFTNYATGGLMDEPSGVVSIDYALDGAKTKKTLTEADSGSIHTVQWQLAMAPVGSAGFKTGTEGQLKSLDLGQIKVELTQK